MDDLVARLKRCLPPKAVLPGRDAPGSRVDGLVPEAVVHARSVADVSATLAEAARDGTAVYPRGGGTAMGYGGAPVRPGIVLDTRGLGEVVEHAARDMTITVQAGATVADLQARLSTQGQRLALDPAQPAQATVGGIIATGAGGPLRYASGTVRDHLLGVTVVDAYGRVVSGGGRVVKNVAGYNLCRLYAGSLGTLGVIVEATFQVRPLPAAHACLWAGFASADQADRALADLVDSQAQPAYIELLCEHGLGLLEPGVRPAAGGTPWWIAVGVQGQPESVRSGHESIAHVLTRAGATAVDACDGDRADAAVRALADWPVCPGARVVWQAGVLSSHVTAFCEQAVQTARRQRLELALASHAGSGIVLGAVLGEPCVEAVKGLIDALHAQAAPTGGSVIVRRAPTEWKPALPTWGAPQGDRHLMRRLKQALDPQSILNPGRFIDGL